jgi:hypothetical protein
MTSRRDMLRALSGFAVLPVLGVDELIDIGRRAHTRAARGTHRTLTSTQHATVEAVAEIIIPRTATAGATDARVADFIDVMLADWYSTAERDRFLAGLDELDERTPGAAGRAFIQMAVEIQRGILERIDRQPRTNEHWFSVLKYLTAWGYYTSRVGIVDELRVQLTPGRYDGNASY